MAEVPFEPDDIDAEITIRRFSKGGDAMLRHLMEGELSLPTLYPPDDPDGGETARLRGPSPSDIGGIALNLPEVVSHKDSHDFKLAA